MSLASAIRGSLLGGALGDALGYAVEFDLMSRIRERFGADGLRDFSQLDGPAEFSDDTQMTLYSADGLNEALAWARDGVRADELACVWLAYLRWLRTQNAALPESAPHPVDRWLDEQPVMHHRRHPGNACLTGLASGQMGTLSRPVNPNSKGCGTVMRAAPFGMVPQLAPDAVLKLSTDAAALTHGHPAAHQAAAQFSLLIHELLGGATLQAAAAALRERISADTTTDPAMLGRVTRALELAGAGTLLSPEDLIAELGEGWVAEEALAVALYATLVTADDDAERHFRTAVAVAVNHDGDSDSTGSLAGNIVGAVHGEAALPAEWLGAVTGLDVVRRIAQDLADLISE
ncbi:MULTISPECIES: ADP-ribosylglycohydrolase family protein [Arthrobacter]|uniref:ADP-ribosylglycohydrolase family protein n=2 Tax=Arthrobacter TaxID=1663 RepID=A0ABU9KND1_9MICC|nr:ADP-ribosylglycohydrolase family protein [Arthrobacter sp. YJM1]MDP5228357.1 ADP-ribosylglycohydrolase family protein [Arthrobacter sp. YJM1]